MKPGVPPDLLLWEYRSEVLEVWVWRERDECEWHFKGRTGRWREQAVHRDWRKENDSSHHFRDAHRVPGTFFLEFPTKAL